MEDFNLPVKTCFNAPSSRSLSRVMCLKGRFPEAIRGVGGEWEMDYGWVRTALIVI